MGNCRHRRSRKRGAVAVETALVMVLTTSFVFGIFEYGRLLMVWNLLNNASREGCRYALVNNTSATISSDVTTVVTSYMAGQNANLSSFTVTVSGTHNGINTTVNNLASGDMITVAVSGTFNFMNIIPLYRTSTGLTLKSSVTMVCEGGT